MSTEKLIVIAVFLFVLALIAAVTFEQIQPQDLVCRDFVRSTEDTYTMLDCYQGSVINVRNQNRFNLVLRVESQVVEE